MGNLDSSDAHAPKIKPYKYQEFPRMMHKSGPVRTCVVTSQEQKDAAIAKGWMLQPPQPLPSAEDLDLVAVEQEIKNAAPARPGKVR